MKKFVNGEYIEMTAEEIAELQAVDPALEIEQLKAQLAETNDKVIEYAEGLLTAEEYAPTKAERQALRERINELEAVS